MKRTPFFKSKLPWFNFLAFPPAAAEPQGCCSLNKRQLPGPVSGAGASWVFSPSSPLPSVHPTPVGRWWGGKPCSTTPQLQHEESEDRRGLSPELCAPVWRGPHKWGCVLLAGHHQTWERAASQRHFCPWISKPSARFRKRLSDVPPKRKKEVLKGGIWGEEVTHGLKERWAGSDSQPRQQKRSPTVPSRGNGDEEGAWGSRASGTATVLHSPPGRRIFNASHPLPPPPQPAPRLAGVSGCAMHVGLEVTPAVPPSSRAPVGPVGCGPPWWGHSTPGTAALPSPAAWAQHRPPQRSSHSGSPSRDSPKGRKGGCDLGEEQEIFVFVLHFANSCL